MGSIQAPPTVELATYLFTRLQQLGVGSIHGVPGDFNLTLLDFIERQGLHWVGNCNELNAGYASDGYARIKGLGAVITTFGVGELSVINAIAGAYAELVPVVHIVGVPSRDLQDSRARVHHTFNDGEFGRFALMQAHVTIAQTNLIDPRTCPDQIDSVLQQCLLHSRPVYIQVPVDMVSASVDGTGLRTPLTLPQSPASKDEDAGLEFVLERMYASERPMILVDGESRAYGIVNELHRLMKVTQWPTWTTIFGKGLIDESLSNNCGCWKGDFASQAQKDSVYSRDLILCFGPHFSLTNTYGFSTVPDLAKSILIKETEIDGLGGMFRDVPAQRFLSKLIDKIDKSRLKKVDDCPTPLPGLIDFPKEGMQQLVSQDKFWYTLSNLFRPGDIILADTGTAGYGSHDFRLPPGSTLFKPVTWLSIGYMLPAAQGAGLAQRELHERGKWHIDNQERPPRTILIIGDGSFQMTAQELSVIIREKLNVLVMLINNDGYTIERCIHGLKENYNGIAFWRYLKAPSLFGASEATDGEYPTRTSTIKTWEDLQNLCEDKTLEKQNAFQMVEVFMGKEDAPPYLLSLLDAQLKRVVAKE